MSRNNQPFKSDMILSERVYGADLKAYHVGFDGNKFRFDPLVDLISKVVPEFALGLHEGTSVLTVEMTEKLGDAARRVFCTDKYRRRGEFGEMVLHLLLRDYHNTIPLISKIYFKDSPNAAVHGFDAIHASIDGANKKLWLGESKIYSDGATGVRALADDVFKHLKADYLRSEFSLITRKLPETAPDIDYWRKLIHRHTKLDDIFKSICIPLVCTYSSEIFKSHTDATTAYFAEFEKECRQLKKTYDVSLAKKKIRSNLEIYLLLLPIPNKVHLVDALAARLKAMRTL